jgi:hypothetical protein
MAAVKNSNSASTANLTGSGDWQIVVSDHLSGSAKMMTEDIGGSICGNRRPETRTTMEGVGVEKGRHETAVGH